MCVKPWPHFVITEILAQLVLPQLGAFQASNWIMHTVEVEIGLSSEHWLIVFILHILRCTSTILGDDSYRVFYYNITAWEYHTSFAFTDGVEYNKCSRLELLPIKPAALTKLSPLLQLLLWLDEQCLKSQQIVVSEHFLNIFNCQLNHLVCKLFLPNSNYAWMVPTRLNDIRARPDPCVLGLERGFRLNYEPELRCL